MGFWDDRVAQHRTTIALKEATELASSLMPIALEHPDPKIRNYASAISLVLEDVVGRLELADPRLITQQMLDTIQRPAATLRGELQALVDNTRADPGQLMGIHNIHGVAESLLTAAQVLPPSPWQAEPDIVRSALRRFRDRVAAERRETEAKLEDLVRQGESATSSLLSQQDELVSRIREITQGMAVLQDVIDQRSGEFGEVVDSFLDRAKMRSRELDHRFDLTLERRTERFEESESDRQRQFEQSLAELRDAWQKEFSEQKATTEQLKEEVRGLAAESKSVLGFSAAASTYEATAREADRQERAANWWRRGAVVALAGAALSVILYLAFFGLPEDPTIAEMLGFLMTRIGVTGFIGALAAYAIREAGQHRTRERIARQAAVDIASFRPFLAELPEHERNAEIRFATRRHFFSSSTEREPVAPAEGEQAPLAPGV